MKDLKTHKNVEFKHNHLHKKKEPHAIFYLKQRMSFWVATLSVFTFLIGNMMGQHGWYGFWASVLGAEDNTAIAYMGTVMPLENIVDYGCWAELGGDYKVHTFRQSPESCRKPLPQYITASNRDNAYSMQYMSSYDKTVENSGTHVGIDVRVPVGTPVSVVMNGRIYKTGSQPHGFGNFVVVEHPNVPDPDNPTGGTVTLYSSYAHLSTVYGEVGDIVMKGDSVALSGNTGTSSGPHLDFQIIGDDAPFYPFYPSTQREGYAHSINPMLYVQSNYGSMREQSTVVARSQRRSRRADNPSVVVAPRRIQDAQEERHIAVPDEVKEEISQKTIIARLQARRESRIRERLATRDSRIALATRSNALTTGLVTESTAQPEPVVARREVASEETERAVSAHDVKSVEISHDGFFASRGWEKVTIRLLDEDGNVVTSPNMDTDLHLRAAYGTAEFRPSVLSPLDFEGGEATVHVLPRSRRTVVIVVQPFGITSRPLQFERQN
ncbi:MAG: M23 family metallopeptidase [Candidatus Peribacteraceae bacterium]|nr:M23 family metallopeptidase [Candidatus Peribacteraceae bacterium]